jgi:hypothetical protein
VTQTAAHTLGPWTQVTGLPELITGAGSQSNWGAICTVDTKHPRWREHASLIARAPELLAENEQLRAALRKIRATAHPILEGDADKRFAFQALDTIDEQAAAALEGK